MRFSKPAYFSIRSTGIAVALLWLFASGALAGQKAEDRLTARWAGRILQSLNDHPRLVAGRAATDMAVAKVETARQPIYEPNLALEWKQRGAQSAGSNFEVFIAQKVDLAGKSEARTRIMESNSEASREDYRVIRQDLLQTILNSQAEKWMSARLVENSRKKQTEITDFAQLLEKHEKAGRVSVYDVDYAYLRLADSIRVIAELEESHFQSAHRLVGLIGEAGIPDHLPHAMLDDIRSIEEVENKVRSLAPVAAARWRFESSRAGMDAVEAERLHDPTVGLLGGKDENDNFIGAVVIVPLALRSSSKPFHEVSSQAALIDEQNYLEAFRVAQSRLRKAETVYRNLFARWKEWHRLTNGRIDHREKVLRRLWDSGEITSVDYLSMLKERADARNAGVRMSTRVWIAWIEWLAATGDLESWLRELAGFE